MSAAASSASASVSASMRACVRLNRIVHHHVTSMSMSMPMATPMPMPPIRAVHTSATSGTDGGVRLHPIYRIPTPHDPYKLVQDKLLFTPGPLTTSYTVKRAMMVDFGSRDGAFIKVIRDVQSGLLDAAGLSDREYAVIPVQGSGTFGVESVISSVVDKAKGLLVIANGAYGLRINTMAQVHGIPIVLYSIADNVPPSLEHIEHLLKTTASNVSHVAVVHSETTSGIVNDVEAVGQVVHRFGKSFIVDAMSSFGAVPVDFKKGHIDYLVSSSNKCIEGVPGFSFVIAREAALNAKLPHNPSTLSLALPAQLAGLKKDGQFRFTPPVHALLAFRQALEELQQEGGVAKRAERYRKNQQVLMAGMKKLGFELYLKPELQGYIISSYLYPTDPNWSFTKFYDALNEQQCVIYPGKVSQADCFRIGHIGRLFPEDMTRLLDAIERTCQQMKTAVFYPASRT